MSSPRPAGAEPGASPNRAPESERDEWFDLFFDLVFAVAIVLWAERLAEDPTARAWAWGVAKLVPIWMLWLGQTVFAARFPSDGPRGRLRGVAVVVAVGIMSTELVADAPLSWRFPLGFVAARAALLALYASVRRLSSDARGIADAYLIGFGAGAAIWALSLLLAASDRPAVWALAIAVDFAVPWLARRRLERMPLDHRYVPARVGTFTSLLLYVSIESLVRGLTQRAWSAWTSVVAVLSFALVVTIRWIYAARVHRQDMRSAFGSGLLPYLYSHLAIMLGVKEGARRWSRPRERQHVEPLPPEAGPYTTMRDVEGTTSFTRLWVSRGSSPAAPRGTARKGEAPTGRQWQPDGNGAGPLWTGTKKPR